MKEAQTCGYHYVLHSESLFMKTNLRRKWRLAACSRNCTTEKLPMPTIFSSLFHRFSPFPGQCLRPLLKCIEATDRGGKDEIEEPVPKKKRARKKKSLSSLELGRKGPLFSSRDSLLLFNFWSARGPEKNRERRKKSTDKKFPLERSLSLSPSSLAYFASPPSQSCPTVGERGPFVPAAFARRCC